MIVKIVDIDKHRNETTFRPYLQIQELFKEVGIEFVFEGNQYDMAWIGQASYTDKSKSLKESTDDGLKYLEKFKDQDYILFDGQDSASLIGVWEVFKESSAKLLLKNSLYNNTSLYNLPAINGRHYWVNDGYNPNILTLPTNLKLSGTNWLSTVQPNFFYYKTAKKDIDVFAMFQYPAKENWEYDVQTSYYYTEHRSKCINELKRLPRHIKVVTAEAGKVPLQEYYNLMSRSKIVIAPFGYGEIAPRDLESAMVGSILLKPDMSHISTIPDIFIPGLTYVSLQWNYVDLGLHIEAILKDFPKWQEYYVENMRCKYVEEYNPEKLVTHIYNLILNMGGYST